jgi:hypothetical protein
MTRSTMNFANSQSLMYVCWCYGGGQKIKQGFEAL